MSKGKSRCRAAGRNIMRFKAEHKRRADQQQQKYDPQQYDKPQEAGA